MWLTLVLTVGAASPARPDALYTFEWRSFARIARTEGGETSSEQRGRGTATLVSLPFGLLRLEFHGDDGDGSGVIGPGGPQRLTFPTPLPVDVPPAPPHLIGGFFEPYGDPLEPDAFRLQYIEGFICHTTPQICSDIATWEREFTASATRIAPPPTR